MKPPQDLLTLKAELEKPGIGRYRHDLAESFKGRKDVPVGWIQDWIGTKWYILGHKYLWLAAMNACIGRDDISLDLIDQGLRKVDPDTFNAAIEACRGRKVPFGVILYWYGFSLSTPMRRAALNACVGNSEIPEHFLEDACDDTDIRIRQLATKLLDKKRLQTRL